MAMLGKAVRLSRLVDSKSNKMMAITVDHAISRGIAGMKGLQPIQDTIDKIILGCPNAITMTKGIAERCMWKHAGKIIILLLRPLKILFLVLLMKPFEWGQMGYLLGQ